MNVPGLQVDAAVNFLADGLRFKEADIKKVMACMPALQQHNNLPRGS
jgi:hypothetical protein